MRCPTCGASVMVRKGSWECGYCCDCGNLPRPRIVLTVDVEEEPKLTIESLAENVDPDTALLRKFSEPPGAWDIEELSAMGAVEILERALTTLAAAMLLSEIAQGVPVQQRDRAAPCPAPARSARIRRKAAPAYFLYQWQL